MNREYFDNYAFGFVSSIILLMLLWDTYILVTFFWYGKVEMTKLNDKPFIIMFFGLILSYIDVILLLSD